MRVTDWKKMQRITVSVIIRIAILFFLKKIFNLPTFVNPLLFFYLLHWGRNWWLHFSIGNFINNQKAFIGSSRNNLFNFSRNFDSCFQSNLTGCVEAFLYKNFFSNDWINFYVFIVLSQIKIWFLLDHFHHFFPVIL